MTNLLCRSALLAGVGFAAFATPAMAQEAAPAPAAAAAGGGTADIIVTAQRRAERAQDVPIVVSAFSADRLDKLNVTQPQDLYGTVPSLVVGNQGTAQREAQNFSIRGQATGYQSSPAVVEYLSEVPLPASTATGLQGGPGLFVDLENVQVLSGPQGTLFGRNTTGGAVLFTPKKPGGEFGGYIEGSIGSYNLKAIQGAVTIPIIGDKLSIRVVGAYDDRRGFTKDLVWNKWRDNTHWYSGRVGIMMKPTERLQNYLVLYGLNSSNNGAGHVLKAFNTNVLSSPGLGFCYNGPSIPFTIASCDVYQRQVDISNQNGPRRTRMSVDEYSKIKTYGAINTTSYDLTDELTFRNIFSYQRFRNDYANDEDASPLQQYELNQTARNPNFPVPGLQEFGLPLLGYNNAVTSLGPRRGLRQITEEPQIQGKFLDGKLNFTTGLFYYDAKDLGTQYTASLIYCPAEFTGLCPTPISTSQSRNKSKAVYAQGTLDLGTLTPALDRLRFTGGFRYTWDDLSASGARAFTISPRLKEHAPTWTIGLDYRPVDKLLVYAKASRGYKSGGINAGAVRITSLTFQPEKLTTYEAGFKSDWRLASMPVRFNATAYYSDYANIQRPGSEYNPDNNLTGAVILPAQATIKGVEIEASIRPWRGVEIGGTFSHTDPKYKKFVVPAISGAYADCGGKAPPGFVDVSCSPFQFVTKWLYNIYGSFEVPLSESLGGLTLYASYSHVSKQPTAPYGNDVQEPGSVLAPHGVLNASLAWHDIGKSGLDATVFATNLANKTYRVSNSNVYNSLLVQSVLYGEPRMFGLKMRYSFGNEHR